jgi:hypothetical protein
MNDRPEDPCAICGEPLGDVDPHDTGQLVDACWCHPACCPVCRSGGG